MNRLLLSRVYSVMETETRLAFPPAADEHFTRFDAHFVTPHAISTPIRPLTVPKIECQIVPGAGNHMPLHAPLAQRPSFMRTKIGNGVKGSVHIEDSDCLLIAGH